jgi:Peptidase family M28
MIDSRIYRLAFLPALIVVVAVMFSLQSIPAPLEAGVSASAFDEQAAAANARHIVERAPARTPGSPGDSEAADLVTDRFEEVSGGELSEQRFSGSFDGDDVDLRNVILVLPGESERQVVLIAQRDSARGPGGASSAAATGALLEIADNFSGTRHRKTLVFVSADGDSDGATGTREFAKHYSGLHLVDAAIVIAQPGATQPQPPFVLPWASGQKSTSIRLLRTATRAVEDQTHGSGDSDGFFAGLMRLALPSALGEQAPLVEAGIDAVTITSAGEPPLSPAQDSADSVSESTLGEFGRATLSVVDALDASTSPPEHGPGTYILSGGRLVPGWGPALLALALLLPAGLVAIDGFARAWRRGQAGADAIGWALGRALPFVAVLLLAYLLSLVGIAPRPRFPYDPGRFEVGWRAATVFVLVGGGLAAALLVSRPLTTPRGAAREGLATGVGLVSCTAVFAVWLINPYLALLLVPMAHVWVATAITDGQTRLAVTLGGLALSLVLPLIALISLAGRLEVGLTVPWHLLLMVTGSQLSFSLALLGCVLAGMLVAVLALALAESSTPTRPRLAVRGPAAPRDRPPEAKNAEIPPIPASTALRRDAPPAD